MIECFLIVGATILGCTASISFFCGAPSAFEKLMEHRRLMVERDDKREIARQESAERLLTAGSDT